MQIGIVFPQNEIGTDPLVIRDYAQTAEGLGFTHILAYDHVLGANPDRPEGFKGPVYVSVIVPRAICSLQLHRSHHTENRTGDRRHYPAAAADRACCQASRHARCIEQRTGAAWHWYRLE